MPHDIPRRCTARLLPLHKSTPSAGMSSHREMITTVQPACLQWFADLLAPSQARRREKIVHHHVLQNHRNHSDGPSVHLTAPDGTVAYCVQFSKTSIPRNSFINGAILLLTCVVAVASDEDKVFGRRRTGFGARLLDQ